MRIKPAWSSVGLVVIIVLPIVVVTYWQHQFTPGTGPFAFILAFVLAVVAVYVGISLRTAHTAPLLKHWGADVLLSALAGAAAWAASRFFLRHGGGVVDPGLLALATAYLLAAWR